VLKSSLRYWGHTDVELSALGIKQAERLRDLLLTEKIDTIYSSDLKRALTTAEIIASERNTEVITCPEIREVCFGELEGLTFDEVDQRYPEVTKSWIEGDLELTYPGGESLAAFIQRTNAFATRLRTLPPEQTILIVAHSGSLRMLICHLLGIGPQHWHQLQLDFASLSMVETHSQGAILKSLNNTSHLGGIN
jgi:alpha-ribazole phosphatase